jgi:ABC-type multidrug transport system ATPase subunit
MLVGLFPPNAGTAYVNSHSITTEMDDVYLSLGFCPQFTIFWPDLTVYEHVLLFSRIKGVPFSKQKSNTIRILKAVGLYSKHRNKLGRQLSGGMERRLAIAISFVGNPKVVLLDEPTTGLDVKSKRELWNVILKEKFQGKTIILTTHSLEEADVLSDKIAIISKGNIRCIGSSQRLKNKFGNGFRLNITFDSQNKTKAIEYINELFNGNAELQGDFYTSASFQIPNEFMVVSRVLKEMKKNKQEKGIKEFIISETTLEDVFINIVKMDS